MTKTLLVALAVAASTMLSFNADAGLVNPCPNCAGVPQRPPSWYGGGGAVQPWVPGNPLNQPPCSGRVCRR